MAKAAVAKTNLNAGELSPRIRRHDLQKYADGLATCKNYIPLPFGGAQKDPGTVFVNEVRDSDKPAIILDWVFGSQQAYILQFNDGVIRFYKDKGTVIGSGSSITIEGITNADPGVVTATAHGLDDGDHVILDGIEGMTEVNGVEFIVANKTADTFELTDTDGVDVDTTSYGTFVASSAVVLLIHFDGTAGASTYTAETGQTVTFAGNADLNADSKFGSTALSLDGTNDYVTVPDDDDFDFSGGVWTVDFWMKPSSGFSDNRDVFEIATDGNNYLKLFITANGNIDFNIYSGGSEVVRAYSGAGKITAGVWQHVAIVENGDDYYCFVDGELIWTESDTDRPANYTGTFTIGHSIASVGAPTSDFTGKIDEFRVTKGVARWTSAFTVPSAASAWGEDTEVQSIYEVAHEFDDDELFELQTAQAADIMYIAHQAHHPQKLSRFDDDNWTIEDVNFLDGPYLDENATATTLDPSETSGSVTVTASAVTGINDGSGFLSTDVGRLVRFHDGTNWFWMKITAVGSTTSITATIKYKQGDPDTTTMGGHAATKRWRLGMWSDTTGWPGGVTFYQGRLCWAGSTDYPQHAWESKVFDFENMDDGAADDDDAITYQLNSDKVNIIQWIKSGKRIVAGTEGENFTIYSGSSSDPITPTNIKADPETNYGVSKVNPIKVGSYLYYVQDDLKTLREFYYDFAIDSFRSINRSILSEHITAGQIKQMAYQKSPFGIIYCVLNDGKMATFTREIEQEVMGWANHETRSGDSYHSVAAIPVEGYTEIWFVVERVINGVTKKYVEYQVSPNQDRDSDLEDMILMQSALTYQGSASTITGLDHLEGETVVALCDGEYVTGTVSDGELALGDTYQKVHVGLPVTGQIKLLPFEGGSAIGTSQGMEKKVNEIMVSVYNSLGIQVGEDGGNMEELFIDGNGAALTTLQTDDFFIPSTLGWDKKQQLFFESTKPFPSTILMIVMYEYTAEK